MARRLIWVGLAVASAYVVFIGGSWFGIYDAGLRLATIVLAAVVFAAWVVVAGRDPAWRPRSTLLPAIGACLASLGISTVFSRFQGISLEYVGYAVVLAGLYLLLVQLLMRDFFRARFIALTGALLIATIAAYFAFTVADWVHWLTVLGRLTIPPLRPEFESLTFGNPSAVLTLVALLAVPVVGSIAWNRRRGIVVAIVVLVLVALVAFVSGSRAGWLALAIAGLVGIAGVAIDPSGRATIRDFVGRQLASTRSRAATFAVVAVVAIAAVVFAPAIIRRAAEGGESNRIGFARIALELFAQSPIVGTGPGSWVIQRPGLTGPADVDEYIPHAHDIYAQTLAELGIVGAIAGIVLIVFLARLIVGAIRDPDINRRRMGWATLIGLVYFGAHQLLDFYANFPSILLVAAIPVAFLDATAIRNPERHPRHFESLRPAILWSSAAAVAVAIVLLGAQELPAMDEARAVERANVGDWGAADGPARAAASEDPRIASYLFTAGLTAAHTGDHAAAAADFEAVTVANDLPEAWLDLAAEQLTLGDTTAAIGSLRAAMRIGDQRPAVAIGAGDLALRLHEHDLAVQAFTAAAIAVPSFLADPWWTEDPSRAAIRVEVTNAAMASTSPSTQWEIALMTGDLSGARRLAQTPGLDPSTIDFVDAWDGDDAAYVRLIARCQTDPLSLQPLFWCARIEGRHGNLDRANDYRYLANAIIGGAYRNGAELRVATSPMIGRSSEGNPAIFWGTYTYRRPTPWDVLVPSLVHLTLE